MPVDLLKENDSFVVQLRKTIQAGKGSLSDVPMMLKCILKEDRWQHRVISTGEPADFERFEDFVTEPPLKGLGTTIDLIRRICGGDPETLDLLDQVLQHNRGKPPVNGNNVTNIQDRPEGNTSQKAIRRLRKDRPDLHAKVIAKEITPHAAMIEAGFRPKEISVPINQPKNAAGRLANHCPADTLRLLIVSLAGKLDLDSLRALIRELETLVTTGEAAP